MVSPKAVSPASLKLDTDTLNLGSIPLTQNTIIATVGFLNTGTEPLYLRRLVLPCNCVTASSLDKVVRPGERGTARVEFDKSKLPVGPIRRTVSLEAADGSRIGVFHVRMNIQGQPAAEDVRISPGVIDYGRQSGTYSILRNKPHLWQWSFRLPQRKTRFPWSLKQVVPTWRSYVRPKRYRTKGAGPNAW